MAWRSVGRVLLIVGSVGALCSQAHAGGGTPDEHAKGKSTEIVSDTLKETKVNGKTVFVQTVTVKNTTAADVTVQVTSQPWTKGVKSKEVETDGKITYVSKDPVPGSFPAKQTSNKIVIHAGQTKSVTFSFDEKFKYRYTDVYVNGSNNVDSGSNSEFDVGSLSPFQPIFIPPGGVGKYAFEQLFLYPDSLLTDLGGAPASFTINPDVIALPAGWTVDFVSPALGSSFTMVGLQEPIPLDVELDIATPAVAGQEAAVSYYVVTDDYRYHVLATAVVPEPNTGLLLASALTGLVVAMGQLRRGQARANIVTQTP